LVAPSAEDGEHRGQAPEREEHTEGEYEPVRHHLAALVARLVDEAEDLDPEHRENAGHQV
jgi:hypothetical protein